MITAEQILATYPQLKNRLMERYWRKYELQSLLKCSQGELDMIIDVLMAEGLLERSTQGWRWKLGHEVEL